MFFYFRLCVFFLFSLLALSGCASTVTTPPVSQAVAPSGGGNNLPPSVIPVGRISEGARGSFPKRLHRIAFWVFAANSEFCPSVAPDIGATLVHGVDLLAAQSYFSERIWSPSSVPRDGFYALHIVPGGPARKGRFAVGGSDYFGEWRVRFR